MTAQDIITAVRSEVVEPNPAFFQTNTLITWINRAQSNYVRRTRVLQNFAVTSTVLGQSNYTMPSDWLGSERVFYNFPVNGIDSWTPLTPTTVERIGNEHPNFLSSDPAQLGKPAEYYIIGETLFLFPKPLTNGSGDLFMFYESKPIPIATLTDPISIDDSLVDGIESYLLWKMWRMDQEPELAQEERVRYEGQTPGGSGGEIGQGLKWKKKRVLEGKWKMDIQSFLPFNYSSINNSAFNNQLNPLNL
jgi:hypothetical protein